jgi:hypothetical protein
MKYKIYKQKGLPEFVNKLPITDINFQIASKNHHQKSTSEVKPRLDEILAEYRKMNQTVRNKQDDNFRKYSHNS